MKKFGPFTLIILMILSCSSNKNTLISEQSPGPAALVYKTKANYTDKVPIGLSMDKEQVVSFPHPNDLKVGNQLSIPTKLIRGYLLDNRGIGKNVAFLNYSYSEYAALNKPPSPEQLKQAILDDDPLLEMWNCGIRTDFKTVYELNQLIKKNFKGAKKVK